jgi:nitronate monooxygenase
LASAQRVGHAAVVAPFSVDTLAHPIVLAPLAGVGTPRLAAAVSRAGGLGFLPAGYLSPDRLRQDLDQLRALLPDGVPFGVNVFAAGRDGEPDADVTAYAERLAREASRYGVRPGEPRWDDDHYGEKLEIVGAARVPVVSFTFGCPAAGEVTRLKEAGCAVWATVTTPGEARVAVAAGVDALVAQGAEAGGHRGSFDDAAPSDLGLLALLQLVRGAVGGDVPLVAAGGIATGEGVAAVLAAGAAAAQVGTAFMLCPEAGTVPSVREVLRGGDRRTALTRAFTGRTARGIVNRFLREHSADAPRAYPQVHHLTSPIRSAARAQGDAEGLNLWAGQAYPLAEPAPAADVVTRLAAGARAALEAGARRWSSPA